MNTEQLVEELECSDPQTEVFVEINGVVHSIHEFKDDSQGVYLIVDTDQEERDMR